MVESDIPHELFASGLDGSASLPNKDFTVFTRNAVNVSNL